mmetsp:Transcript_67914/g.203043  ORF Transcript_67914/g.203043 Transcript_67914/m.203043 type:complete len:104 (-) Transcript_67914:1187-1498(-)
MFFGSCFHSSNGVKNPKKKFGPLCALHHLHACADPSQQVTPSSATREHRGLPSSHFFITATSATASAAAVSAGHAYAFHASPASLAGSGWPIVGSAVLGGLAM